MTEDDKEGNGTPPSEEEESRHEERDPGEESDQNLGG
jgi:hypothetical protein